MTYNMCSPQGQAQKTCERTTWDGHLGGSEKTRVRVWAMYVRRVLCGDARILPQRDFQPVAVPTW